MTVDSTKCDCNNNNFVFKVVNIAGNYLVYVFTFSVASVVIVLSKSSTPEVDLVIEVNTVY